MDRTAVVVGIGPGLGAALVRRFAQGSYRVVGLARNPARLTPEPSVIYRAADAADPASLAAALDQPVDVLIYNAYRATMVDAPSALDPATLVPISRSTSPAPSPPPAPCSPA